MIWQVAAGVIIGGVCLGLLWFGVMMAGAPGHPNETKGTFKIGIGVVVAGLLIAALAIVMAISYL